MTAEVVAVGRGVSITEFINGHRTKIIKPIIILLIINILFSGLVSYSNEQVDFATTFFDLYPTEIFDGYGSKEYFSKLLTLPQKILVFTKHILNIIITYLLIGSLRRFNN